MYNFFFFLIISIDPGIITFKKRFSVKGRKIYLTDTAFILYSIRMNKKILPGFQQGRSNPLYKRKQAMADDTVYKRAKEGKELLKSGGESGTKIRFQDRDIDLTKTIKIGRDPGNDIVITDDPLVSRKHALIEILGGKVYLEDKESTNGTYVNKNPLQSGQRVEVRKGDVIQVGKTELKVMK